MTDGMTRLGGMVSRLGARLTMLGSALLAFVLLSAHIGTNQVVFEGQAGGYPVRVLITPPGVVPAQVPITVRVLRGTPTRVTVRAAQWNVGTKGAPPAEDAAVVPGDPGVWAHDLWIMTASSYAVYVAVEGPALRPGYESFVGAHDIACRHGLTMGELARLYARDLGLPDEAVEVVGCTGWRRGDYGDACGLPWVLPSPNMPTVDTAVVYPGQCLLEGTNLSEGRGSTRPFEICGAPWVDAAALARRLGGLGLPGVAFRPVTYRPTFQKHAGLD